MPKRTPPPVTGRLLNQPSKERVLAVLDWLMVVHQADEGTETETASNSVVSERSVVTGDLFRERGL